MKRGVPPTALNARTGEFTPPGMTAQASSNSFDETSVRGDDAGRSAARGEAGRSDKGGDDAGRSAARGEAGRSDRGTLTSVPAVAGGFTTGCRRSVKAVR